MLKGELKVISIHEHLKLVLLDSPNAVIMRLLVYSMFWRTDISSLEIFNEYKLNKDLSESLRENLLRFKALTRADLEGKIKENTIDLHPYASMTAESFKDETANVLAAINPGIPASLHVDKFGFYIFPSKDDLKGNFMGEFSNSNMNDNQIIVISEKMWYDIMVKKPLEMAVEQAKRKLLNLPGNL